MNGIKQLAWGTGLALLMATVIVASTVKMSTVSAQTLTPTRQSSESGQGVVTNSSQQGARAPAASAEYGEFGMNGEWRNEGAVGAGSEHTLGQMFGHWMAGHEMGEWQNDASSDSSGRNRPRGMGPVPLVGDAHADEGVGTEGFFLPGE